MKTDIEKTILEAYMRPEMEEVEIITEAICGGGESGKEDEEDPWI